MEELIQTKMRLQQENQRLQMQVENLQAELASARAQRQHSETVVELASDAIFHGDTRGNFVGFNQRAIELTGYSREELLTMNMAQFFSEAERQRVPLRYDLLRQGKVVCNERHLTRKDQTTVLVEMCSKMLADGTYHAVIRDVSHFKEMEQAELDFFVHQRALSEATFEAIVLTSKGKCIGVNSNAVEMFGYSLEELYGRESTMLVAPEERDRVRRKIEAGYEKVYETVMLTRDGRRIPAEVRGREVIFRGRQLRVAAIHDISHRQQAEKDRQIIHKLESVGTLAGGIAHDFNNILTGLFGNISLVRMHLDADHPAFRYVEQAEKSLSRATTLTARLLTFAKGGEPVTEAVSLAELVEETVMFDLSGSNVKLVLDAQEGLWQAEADRGQIQQVFSNLAINANQAMADGGRLFITLRNYEHGENDSLSALPPGRYLHALVQDEGVGISPRHLSRVFDPYFSTKQAGRGLGLASVYSIVSKHRGLITVSSEPGSGTTFCLYLPASDRSAKGTFKSAPAAVTSAIHSAHVLVMDDDPEVCAIVRAMLERMQCRVDTVEDGQQAIDHYRRALAAGQRYDLVILDLTVPGGWGGKETIGPLLEVDPDARVVVSSGYTEDPIMSRFMVYGFQAVLPKPYVYRQFESTITAVLQDAK